MPDHTAFEQEFAAMFLGWTPIEDPGLERALSIHRNTAFKAASDALADNYPVVRSLCGEEPFAACAQDYVATTPPSDPRLCLYGANFPTFVAAYAPFLSLDWLPDIARLERFCLEALFAADALALDSSGILTSMELGQAPRLHPAVRIGRFNSPAASIWLAHQGSAPEEALSCLDWAAETALVSRPADTLLVTPIDAGAAAFLSVCSGVARFEDAAAAAAETGVDVATAFSILITAGVFA